jgi:hypothetical protein
MRTLLIILCLFTAFEGSSQIKLPNDSSIYTFTVKSTSRSSFRVIESNYPKIIPMLFVLQKYISPYSSGLSTYIIKGRIRIIQISTPGFWGHPYFENQFWVIPVIGTRYIQLKFT